MQRTNRTNVIIATLFCIFFVVCLIQQTAQFFKIGPEVVTVEPILKPPPSKIRVKVNKTEPFHSQEGQDKAVYDIFPIENGFFIEMGAYDGQTISNSLWLERRHNWTGLLIEADPELCKKIDQAQRNAWRLCACISETQRTLFYQNQFDKTLGSVQGSLNKRAVKKDKHVDKKEIKKSQILIPCYKLQYILKEIRKSHINYFSLDVEGAEMVVLQTIKDALISRDIVVDVWTVEYAVYMGKKEQFIRNLYNIRKYFKEVGGYTEHSHVGKERHKGLFLDVIFVYTETWCRHHQVLPNGKRC